jgi:hypothetical protein
VYHFFLVKVEQAADGTLWPVLLGPFGDIATQKQVARAMMSVGAQVLFLDTAEGEGYGFVGEDGVRRKASVGRISSEDG